jgi:outer membrane receptor protein involved in Fe transport
MQKLFFTSLLFTLLVQAVSAQTRSASGKVTDATTHEALPFVTLAVFNHINGKDTLVAGGQTDEQGNFLLHHLPATGTLTIRLSFMGYQTLTQPIPAGENANLGTLALQQESQQLQEIKITGEKEDVTITPDKRIFNVSKNLTALGGTAETLLRNVPSVSIDESGSPSLRNMAATIYINGKPTQLTLAQIPASQIESVEVISNPSARYEAAASGGIINLVLKQNRLPGYNGMLLLGIGNNHRYDATANIDWQVGKWNIIGLYSLNATQNPLNGYLNQINYGNAGTQGTYFDQATNITLNNRFQSGRLSAGYSLNSRNLLTWSGTVVAGVYNTVSNQQYSYYDENHNMTGYGNRSTIPHNDFTNLQAEFDWKHTFARKGEELRLISSFTHNRISNAGDWQTNSFILDSTHNFSVQPNYPVSNRIDGATDGNQTLVQIDYIRPVNDQTKWEFGIRSFTYVRNQLYLFNEATPENPEFQLLTSYSQNARISEMVNGIYGLYHHKLSLKTEIELGLRLEQSNMHGLSHLDDSRFGYDYPSGSGGGWFQSFFPSFSLSRKVNENSEWAFNLSRKVGRPNFRHMFVGIQANDRQNITIGNPKVRPEFVNTAEINYNKSWDKKSGSWQWLATAYYIYEDHTIKPVVTPLSTDSTILVTSFQNVKADVQYGIDNTLTWSTGKLSVLTNFNVFNIMLQSATISNQIVRYNAKISLTYKFGAGITAQLTGQRQSRTVGLQGFREAVTAGDFSLRKGFWQNRGSLTFTVNDIFNSRKFINIYDQPATYQVSMSRRDVRFFKLTLQVPLGRGESNKAKEKKIDRPDIDFSN